MRKIYNPYFISYNMTELDRDGTKIENFFKGTANRVSEPFLTRTKRLLKKSGVKGWSKIYAKVENLLKAPGKEFEKEILITSVVSFVEGSEPAVTLEEIVKILNKFPELLDKIVKSEILELNLTKQVKKEKLVEEIRKELEKLTGKKFSAEKLEKIIERERKKEERIIERRLEKVNKLFKKVKQKGIDIPKELEDILGDFIQ